LRIAAFAGAMLLASLCAGAAAELGGDWVGQISGPFDSEYTAQYSHVSLKADGSRIAGTWGPYAASGTIQDGKAEIALTGPTGANAGTLQGVLKNDALSGSGSIMTAVPGARAPETSSAVSWKLTRAPAAPTAPHSYTYDPKFFYGTYAASEPPALHIFPGDTVTTRTIDQTGRDAHAPRHGTGGDVNTGPFYVEGALPGDTLVVHLLKVQVAKQDARQGSRFNQYAVTQAYQLAAKYDPAFNGNWKQDTASMTATLPATPGLPHLTVPLKPMLGCISVAPPGEEQYIGTDLGPYGGNLDYNENVEGATLYFPVFHPGALLGMGDAHGAMGDGEVVGTGLETSANVTFSVEVIRGYATPQVRSENKDYLMSFGVARSVPDSIQLATTQLAQWLKHDYQLNDSEVALLLGDAVKYDITELVDPQFDVVAKIPKSVLATLNK
jgi:acetamidase/formamidase